MPEKEPWRSADRRLSHLESARTQVEKAHAEAT
ncbi:hypothetical protein ACVWXU_008379 [Streptomyces sp. TE33382]